MLHYHALFCASQVIDDTASFYKVAVGTSRQANRDYLYLLAYAETHGYYFHLWDNATAEFYANICKSLAPYPSPLNVTQSNLQHVKARDLVRQLKMFDKCPDAQPTSAAAADMLARLDVNYRVFRHLARR